MSNHFLLYYVMFFVNNCCYRLSLTRKKPEENVNKVEYDYVHDYDFD